MLTRGLLSHVKPRTVFAPLTLCSRSFSGFPPITTTAQSPSAIPLSAASSSSSSVNASFGLYHLPAIKNEPMLSYAPGSTERKKLQAAIDSALSRVEDVPIIVNGREHRTSRVQEQRMPAEHSRAVARYYLADEAIIAEAIRSSLAAKARWEETPWQTRAAVFLKAADLLSTKHRYAVLAATMLGQGKNVWQAEIDAAAETADFWRFGVKYLQEIYAQQPVDNSPGNWNRVDHRPLEGFVYAISPFNFAAIGANLSSAPAVMGNTVIWKPSGAAILSSFLLYRVLEEAGLPAGVINFVPEDGPLLSSAIFSSPHFAGLHFTGSTRTFRHLWQEISRLLPSFRSYPRIVGETGGKNFHFVHPSADRANVLHQTVRSAFEYSGQKCSACSRLYIPRSWWAEFRPQLTAEVDRIIAHHYGPSHHPSTFVSAVIDRASFGRLRTALDKVKQSSPETAQIIAGGETDDSVGYYVQPTVVLTTDPHFFSMTDELFGPILTVFVYEDAEYASTLRLCDSTSPYALTGALFCSDLYAREQGMAALRYSAGNFYINDKSTGAVVGQQPFGGSRGSGTNDKAGGMSNLLRWTSPRSIKENFVHLTDWKYPSITQQH